MNEKKRPTILRIIDSDYTAAVAILLPIILWMLFWLLSILGLFDLQISRDVVIALTVASLGVLAWRCWLISRIFAEGVETPGEIRYIWLYRERGRMMVTFTWEGKKFQKNSTIPKNEYTTALQVGQEIMLVVDRNQPRRAFPRDMYLRK